MELFAKCIRRATWKDLVKSTTLKWTSIRIKNDWFVFFFVTFLNFVIDLSFYFGAVNSFRKVT